MVCHRQDPSPASQSLRRIRRTSQSQESSRAPSQETSSFLCFRRPPCHFSPVQTEKRGAADTSAGTRPVAEVNVPDTHVADIPDPVHYTLVTIARGTCPQYCIRELSSRTSSIRQTGAPRHITTDVSLRWSRPVTLPRTAAQQTLKLTKVALTAARSV